MCEILVNLIQLNLFYPEEFLSGAEYVYIINEMFCFNHKNVQLVTLNKDYRSVLVILIFEVSLQLEFFRFINIYNTIFVLLLVCRINRLL